MKKALYTSIVQREVNVLGPDDYPKYEYNRPGPDWELIEHSLGNQIWVPAYTLKFPKINDHSKIQITERS